MIFLRSFCDRYADRFGHAPFASADLSCAGKGAKFCLWHLHSVRRPETHLEGTSQAAMPGGKGFRAPLTLPLPPFGSDNLCTFIFKSGQWQSRCE